MSFWPIPKRVKLKQLNNHDTKIKSITQFTLLWCARAHGREHKRSRMNMFLMYLHKHVCPWRTHTHAHKRQKLTQADTETPVEKATNLGCSLETLIYEPALKRLLTATESSINHKYISPTPCFIATSFETKELLICKLERMQYDHHHRTLIFFYLKYPFGLRRFTKLLTSVRVMHDSWESMLEII